MQCGQQQAIKTNELKHEARPFQRIVIILFTIRANAQITVIYFHILASELRHLVSQAGTGKKKIPCTAHMYTSGSGKKGIHPVRPSSILIPVENHNPSLIDGCRLLYDAKKSQVNVLCQHVISVLPVLNWISPA